MSARRRAQVVAGIAALLVLAVVPGSASLVPPVPAVAFRVWDTGARFTPEVTLGIQRDGDVFVGGWDYIVRSRDGGRSWDRVGPELGPVPAPFAADRVLVVDRETGRVFVDDTTLGCTVLWWSDDDGDTWTVNPLACGGGITDHQKLGVGEPSAVPTVDYPNVVYVCANGLTHTPCAASFDGGRTFGPGMPAGTVDVETRTVTPACASFQGVPVGASDGAIYQPITACGPEVVWSRDNGLTWRRATVSTGAQGASADAADMAATPNGTLYYLWTGNDWMPYLASSRDGGRTWSAPLRIRVPGMRSALFPVLAAGRDGRIGLAFYATTDSPASWDGNPGDAPPSVRWRLYAAVVSNAEAPRPQIAPVAVTRSPVQTGCLSKLGGCGDENIADYIDADVTPDGRLVVAYVNGCAPTCLHKSSAAFVAVQTPGSWKRL